MRPTPQCRLAVVHLVRQVNDIGHFDAFLEAYRDYSPGLPHGLILILKGFESLEAEKPILARLTDIPWTPFRWPDVGFDIGPYLEVARAFDFDRFCFMNSFTRPQVGGWLAKLNAALNEMPYAGIVGATGSWGRITKKQAFPNIHIRTTGFLVDRSLLLSLDLPTIQTKDDTYAFESGPNSLTRQIMARGLLPYVVDCAGTAWHWERWPISQTFWSGEQERLLLSDNHTRAYMSASSTMRAWYRRAAWQTRVGHLPGRPPKFVRRIAKRFGVKL